MLKILPRVRSGRGNEVGDLSDIARNKKFYHSLTISRREKDFSTCVIFIPSIKASFALYLVPLDVTITMVFQNGRGSTEDRRGAGVWNEK